MFLPEGNDVYGVNFDREDKLCVTIGYLDEKCIIQQGACPEYSSKCVSKTQYTLTIPGEKLTMEEQGKRWKCTHTNVKEYTSPTISLKIAGRVDFLNNYFPIHLH